MNKASAIGRDKATTQRFHFNAPRPLIALYLNHNEIFASYANQVPLTEGTASFSSVISGGFKDGL